MRRDWSYLCTFKDMEPRGGRLEARWNREWTLKQESENLRNMAGKPENLFQNDLIRERTLKKFHSNYDSLYGEEEKPRSDGSWSRVTKGNACKIKILRG